MNSHEPTIPLWACWKGVCVRKHVGVRGTPSFACLQQDYPIIEPIEDEE